MGKNRTFDFITLPALIGETRGKFLTYHCDACGRVSRVPLALDVLRKGPLVLKFRCPCETQPNRLSSGSGPTANRKYVESTNRPDLADTSRLPVR